MSRDALNHHQRRRVVKAAIEVFAKRGFHNTSIDNIVAASESSVGGFYLLFDGKDDCFLYCYDSVIDDVGAVVAESAPSGGGWVEWLAATAPTILQHVESHPLAARLVLVEAQTAGLAAVERYDATMAAVSQALRPGRELAARGEDLPSRLEDAAGAGAAWLLQQRLVRGEAKGIVALLPDILAILAGSYIGEARARALARRALPVGV